MKFLLASELCGHRIPLTSVLKGIIEKNTVFGVVEMHKIIFSFGSMVLLSFLINIVDDTQHGLLNKRDYRIVYR